MNIVKTRNPVEQGYVEAQTKVADALIGGEDVRRLRREAISRFEVTGFPHRRIEEWKYTDLRNMLKAAFAPVPSAAAGKVDEGGLNAALKSFAGLDVWRVVFVDGHHAPELDRLDGAEGLSVRTLSTAGDAISAKIFAGDARNTVADLNTGLASDGCAIVVGDGAVLAKSVVVIHVRSTPVAATNVTRHAIDVGKGAKAAIAEVFVALDGSADEGLTNTLSNIDVGDGAELHHVKCVFDRGGISHLANWQVELGAEANYRAFHFNAGAGLVRNDARIRFNGADGKLDYSGAFLGKGREHTDNTFLVEHLQPGCESRELFKGVLDDSARGIFQGKVHVAQIAQKTDGKQMAQALMLSEDAEFDSKPELEIFADDVLCGHGSTSAELDDDLMFYLRARGIPVSEARALLIESFVGEAIDQVQDDALREALAVLAAEWLAKL